MLLSMSCKINPLFLSTLKAFIEHLTFTSIPRSYIWNTCINLSLLWSKFLAYFLILLVEWPHFHSSPMLTNGLAICWLASIYKKVVISLSESFLWKVLIIFVDNPNYILEVHNCWGKFPNIFQFWIAFLGDKIV